MAHPINEHPFEHRCNNGTVFKAERCDFVGGVTAFVPASLSPAHMMEDAAEMGAWHCANIVPLLNGFTGPPTIEITRLPEEEFERLQRIANMPLMEFFTEERLRKFDNSHLTVRVINCLLNEQEYWAQKDGGLIQLKTLKDLVEHSSVRELLRNPNMGKKSVALVALALAEEGLTLKP